MPDAQVDGADAGGAVTVEDRTLVTLARAARARSVHRPDGLPIAGAAMRDRMGRTFAAGTVDMTALHLDALALVVAMAAASGADGAEAAVIVLDEAIIRADASEAAPDAFAVGVRVLRERAGAGVPILWCAVDGTVLRRSVS